MTATLQEIHQDPSILDRAIEQGTPLEILAHGTVAARLLPSGSVAEPDFAARARRIWGDHPPGKPLSEIVIDSRE